MAPTCFHPVVARWFDDRFPAPTPAQRDGWPAIEAARPNPSHGALAALEGAGRLAGIITQNVDGLHHAAGSRTVVELHGALARVRCLGCDTVEPRSEVQARLLQENPGFSPEDAAMAPDGDAELGGVDDFRVVDCRACGGVLKPDVVFFGGSVPRPVVDDAFALLDTADALLVVGSSLAVFSGYRFVRRARERNIPVALVNLGPTRADGEATLRVEGRAGEVLPALALALQP